jgi:serine/threonine protein kinase
VAKLGEGAHGTTWEAIDQRDGSKVAIKHFDVRGAARWKDVELAEREARVLGSLSHPRLPRYVDHFEEEGGLYLVMEKIEGVPLSVLRKQGGMGEEDVLRLLRDADEALTYLHGRAPAVIHRDLKPSNVLRRPDGSFAFVDFGAVRDRMRADGSTVVGTFGYMAPEQFQGRLRHRGHGAGALDRRGAGEPPAPGARARRRGGARSARGASPARGAHEDAGAEPRHAPHERPCGLRGGLRGRAR